jgi:hypothetical protein
MAITCPTIKNPNVCPRTREKAPLQVSHNIKVCVCGTSSSEPFNTTIDHYPVRTISIKYTIRLSLKTYLFFILNDLQL